MIPMKVKQQLITSILLTFCLCTTAVAQSLYISDKLYVPVRKGQGNQFTILHKGLPSGTRVTLVERDEKWTKVTTSEGISGWIRNQFLSDTPPAAILLNRANSKLDTLSQDYQQLENEKLSLETQLSELQLSLTNTQNEYATTSKELNNIKTISSSAIESHKRLQEMTQSMQLLQTENDVLKSENESLKRSERNTFFLYGIFAVMIGILIALVLPKLQPKKRNDGWIN